MATKTKLSKAVLAVLAACGLVAIMALAACSSPTASSSSSSQVMDVGSSSASSSVAATGSYNVLLTGNDKWVADIPGHPDMVCVLHIDLDNHKIYEVTVPRDSTVYRPDGSKTKLNDYMTEKTHAEQIEMVEQVTGMKIDNYIEIGFTGLEDIVDHFGGVPMDLPYDCLYSFYSEDYPDDQFEAGEQTLDGFRAMEISRARTGYGDQGISDQDMVRQYVCRQMLTNLIQLAYNGGMSGVKDILTNYQGIIDTDIPTETQIAWATKLAENGSFEVIGTTGPFDGDIDPDENIYLCYPAKDEWETLVNAVESNGDVEAAVNSYEYHEFPDATPGVVTTTIKVG